MYTLIRFIFPSVFPRHQALPTVQTLRRPQRDHVIFRAELRVSSDAEISDILNSPLEVLAFM